MTMKIVLLCAVLLFAFSVLYDKTITLTAHSILFVFYVFRNRNVNIHLNLDFDAQCWMLFVEFCIVKQFMKIYGVYKIAIYVQFYLAIGRLFRYTRESAIN